MAEDSSSISMSRGQSSAHLQVCSEDEGSRTHMSNKSGENSQVIFRILCPSSRAGSVIGKGGEVIQELRQNSRAKIKVEPIVPNSEEREILITSQNNEEEETSSAEFALQLVSEKIYCEVEDLQEEEEGTNFVDIHVVRLLISQNQVGPLLGKYGGAIQQMRSVSGANIRILTQEALPTCALPNDEVLQITGQWGCVERGLQMIARKLRQHPPQATPLSYVSSAFKNTPSVITGQHVDTTYRLLVSQNKIGSIIGKGGEVIKNIRDETKARVKIYEGNDDSKLRIICAQSVEDSGAIRCAAGDAIMKCVVQVINDTAKINSEVRSHTIRLLVPTSQAGAVIGKEGSQIRYIIKETGANVRFFQGNYLPECAEGEDELLQIDGATIPCLQALEHCLLKLRQNMATNQQLGGRKVADINPIPHSMPPRPGVPPLPLPSPSHYHPSYLPPHQYCVAPPHASPHFVEAASEDLQNIVCSLKLKLTYEQADKLFGPHGGHFNYIQQECSRVKIFLHQADMDGCNRTVEITGVLHQVQQCAQLILNFSAGIAFLP